MENITNYNIDSLFPRDYEVLFFHAHPDDETFLNAGLLYHLLKLGRKCSLIYCAAWILLDDEDSFIRQNEIYDINDKILHCENIHFLECLDSKYKHEKSLCNYQIWSVINMIQQLLLSNWKYVFVSYDQRWWYGHIDHKKLNCIVTELNNVIPQRHLYYEITINQSLWGRWLWCYGKRLKRNQLPETKYWSKNFWTEESKISYAYNLTNEEITIKRSMFEMYESQVSKSEFPLSLSLKNFSLLFGREYLNC